MICELWCFMCSFIIIVKFDLGHHGQKLVLSNRLCGCAIQNQRTSLVHGKNMALEYILIEVHFHYDLDICP